MKVATYVIYVWPPFKQYSGFLSIDIFLSLVHTKRQPFLPRKKTFFLEFIQMFFLVAKLLMSTVLPLLIIIFEKKVSKSAKCSWPPVKAIDQLLMSPVEKKRTNLLLIHILLLVPCCSSFGRSLFLIYKHRHS